MPRAKNSKKGTFSSPNQVSEYSQQIVARSAQPLRGAIVKILIFFCLALGFAVKALASTEFVAPPGFETVPARIITGPDSNLWFTEAGRGSIGRLTPGGTLTEFPVPGAVSLNAIALGSDGAMWFTDGGASYIGRITTAGVITTYPLTSGNYAVDITSGADGNLWFTEINTPVGAAVAPGRPIQNRVQPSAASLNAIVPDCPFLPSPGTSTGITAPGYLVRMTTQGVVTTFGSYVGPGSITSGPDGNIWFVVNLGGIAKVTTSGAQLSLFPVSSNGQFYYLQSITKGPDGKLWFTADTTPDCSGNSTNSVASITTSGQVTLRFVSLNGGASGQIVTGPDSNLWFINGHGNQISRVTPSGVISKGMISTNNAVSLTPGPGGALWVATGKGFDSIIQANTSGSILATFQLRSQSARPGYITSGPDGALWFTDGVNQIVGRMTTSGVGTSFPAGSPPGDITLGPDGALWFAAGGISRITTDGTVTRFSSATADGSGITLGPDGNLWSTASSAIGRLTPQGVATSFPRTTNYHGSQIVTGSDGNLWFSSEYVSGGVALGAFDSITTNGVITEYPTGCDVPQGDVAAGPDGNLWFSNLLCFQPDNLPSGNAVKVTPSGSISSYAVGGSVAPASIIAGKDGSLWFIKVQFLSGGGFERLEIGRITTSGISTHVSAHVLQNANTYIDRLTTGPDGKLWFTDTGNSLVGRISEVGGTGLTVNVNENTPITVPVASFTDGTPVALASDFTAVINWGDGALNAGIVTGPMGGPFSVSGNHLYPPTGSYQVVVTMHDKVDNADYDSTPGTVNVVDAPLSPGTVFPSGTCMEGTNCPFTLGSFTDADPKAAVGLYTATVDWGDGSTSPGTITACGKEFCVSAYHTFAHNGSYNTKILASDVGGASLNMNGIAVNVTDAPLTAYSATPASPHGVQFTEVIATFTDADPYGTVSDFTASIDWGDTTSSVGTITANTHRSFDVTGTHTYSDPGPHTATITINDVGGSTASATSVVADDYPIIATGTKFHVRLGSPFTAIMATFTDTDPAYNAGDLSATIDWGDGTTSPGTLLSQNNGAFNVQGTHTYTKVFGRNVTVQINDAGGNARAIVTDAIRFWPRTVPY